MSVVAGIDLGGTAVNYTFVDSDERWLIDGLCEHPARSKEGPDICLQQIADGLEHGGRESRRRPRATSWSSASTRQARRAAPGVLSARGSTNFVHPAWAGFDLREALAHKLGKPVTYLNDGNAGALWGHFTIFGASRTATSISAIVGTGLGGGVIVDGNVVKGRSGFGGELGHVLDPLPEHRGIDGLVPECNCGRTGDLESLCSLTAIGQVAAAVLPRTAIRITSWRGLDLASAAKRVRGLAERGDAMCRDIFRVQAHALGLFFDEMINTFDPDALIVGGGAIETGHRVPAAGSSTRSAPACRRSGKEQADIPIHIMPNGDTAGSRGAAIEALKLARDGGLI